LARAGAGEFCALRAFPALANFTGFGIIKRIFFDKNLGLKTFGAVAFYALTLTSNGG